MQLKVVHDSEPVPSEFELWAERFAALPKRNGLAAARAAADEARQSADVAEQAYNAAWRRVDKAGGVLPDAAVNRAETARDATKARLNKASQDVRAATDAAAPALERHLKKHQAEALERLVSALQEARSIARTIARTCDAAMADDCNVPYALRRARRIEIELAHVLSQVRRK